MLTTRKRSLPAAVEGGGDTTASVYENSRSERIKENMERMKKLGILQLSLNLKSECRRNSRIKPVCSLRTGSPSASGKLPSPAPPPRRSSRLQNVPPIQYSETQLGRDEKSMADDRSDWVGVGPSDEIYTEEHEKLLGSCEMGWNLFVDGYDNSGKRIYDQVRGKTCHQCRQKTLGHRTSCIKCNLVQGQFCGDCLYMRYGENVLEVQKNPNWTCPVCRGICNCSLCRVKKGWAPTGALYKRVKSHGYKSVAHFLVLTKRGKSADMKSTEPTFPTKGHGSTNANLEGKPKTFEEEEEEDDKVELAVKAETLEEEEDEAKLALKLETLEEEDKGKLVVKPETLKEEEEDKGKLVVKPETLKEEEDKWKLVVKPETLKEGDKGELYVKLETGEEDKGILSVKHQVVKEEGKRELSVKLETNEKGEFAVKLETREEDKERLALKLQAVKEEEGKGELVVKLETKENGELSVKLVIREEDKGILAV